MQSRCCSCPPCHHRYHDDPDNSWAHPSPMVIFALLFGLAKFAAGGLRHGRQQGSNWLHMLVTAVSIYVILDIEYPRLGLIRVDAFDQLFAREHEVNFGVEPLALTTG